MANKLFVGNLDFKATEQDLKEKLEGALTDCGGIEECKIIFDRETGRSRGFAFVTFSSDDEAKKALEVLNGSNGNKEIKVGDRNIRVSIATDKKNDSTDRRGFDRNRHRDNNSTDRRDFDRNRHRDNDDDDWQSPHSTQDPD